MMPPMNNIKMAIRFLPRLWCGTCYDAVRLAVRDEYTGENCKYLIDRAECGSPYDEEGTDLLDIWEKYSWLKKEYVDLIGEAFNDNVIGKRFGNGNTKRCKDKDETLAPFDDKQAEKNLVKQNQKAELLGLSKLQKRSKFKSPKPSCEVCGKIPAELYCGSCNSVNYCSKSCQKVDWKERGHRERCATLKAKLKRDVDHVLKLLWLPEEIMDDADPEVSYARVRWAASNLLENDASYSLACKSGLHDALRSFFTEDTRKMEARYTNDIPCSWTSMAINSLFKKRSFNPSQDTSKADGEKCANYITSHIEAWPAWLGASVKLANCVFLPIMKSHSELATLTQRDGRDAWGFLQLALIQRECAYAILVECGHAKLSAAILREAMEWIDGKWQGDFSPDPNGTIAGSIATVTGMIQVWHDCFLKENSLKGESFSTILALQEGSVKRLEYDMHYKLAEATISKGKFLAISEANSIGRTWRAGLEGAQEESNSTRSKKKKKKGKKR